MKVRVPVIAILMALFVVGSVHAAPMAQNEPPTAGIVNANSNLRGGPDTAFPVVGSAAQGTSVDITACNDDCTWYQLETGEWIAAFLVDASTAPSPTATPTVRSTADLNLTLVSWNVESGGALQSVVADRIADFDGVDIWGLSEVSAVDAEAYEFGAEDGENADFDALLGTTGRADRLLLIWDAERFEQVDSGEMLTIGETGRAPLWVQLRDRATGIEFIVMVNHLHRSNDGIRHRQAASLNTWAATQELPVIAMGDYNFDWNLPNGETDHDEGYDNLTAGGIWKWVRPAELVTTQCSGWPCRYTSVLDFFFVAGSARDWNVVSEIVVAANDFPDDLTTPDHRPVLAVVNGDVNVPTEQPTATPTVGAVVLLPTATSTTTAVACPQSNGNVNLRGGPGTNYDIVGRLNDGECITITGRNAEGNWYQLDNGSWVAAFLIANAPAIGTIQEVATPAPPPTATPVPTAVAPTATPVPIPPTSIPPTPVPPIQQAVCDCSGNVYNCPNFSTHNQAQACMNYCIAQGVGDIHRLDGDNDGVACESLP